MSGDGQRSGSRRRKNRFKGLELFAIFIVSARMKWAGARGVQPEGVFRSLLLREGSGVSSRPLEGLRVLVVEDEAMLFFMAEDMLTDLGSVQVWHCGRLADALAFLDTERPDIAMLDVNLAGQPVYPVAERLAAADIPFVFATGYGAAGIPARFGGRPVVQKPFTQDMLGEALAAALGPDRALATG
jgi:CheY-like chemotaxis protein